MAHRLALDFPDRVERLAVLDIIPTLEHFERADMRFGLGYYHWFWFAQPHPFPEMLINAAPEAWFHAHTNRSPCPSDLFDPEALADYLAAARQPETITGMCEDYRAAATIDLEHDRESRARGDKIACPLLALWGEKGKIGSWYDAMAIWRAYCSAPVTGGAVAIRALHSGGSAGGDVGVVRAVFLTLRIHRILLQILQPTPLQRPLLCRAQHHARRLPSFQSLLPARRAQTPPIPRLQPGNPNSGRGVERSFPLALLNARNSSVITAQTVWLATSSAEVLQQPSRKNPVSGVVEHGSSTPPSTLRERRRRPSPA